MILIVEDNIHLRTLLQRALARRGYGNVAAANLREARQTLMCRDVAVSWLISDIELTDGLGTDLLEEFPHLSALIISANPILLTAIDTSDGRYRTLAKPFDLDDFLNIIEDMFDDTPDRVPSYIH